MNPHVVATDVTPTARWEDHDEFAGWTITAVLGGLAFIALRIFGLPEADLHTPLHHAGIMDPACGMTRAMWLLGHGRLADAWRYNPGAYALAVAGTFLIVRAVFGATTGRWLTWNGLSRRLIWVVVAIAFTALWINQQANADLLMTSGLR